MKLFYLIIVAAAVVTSLSNCSSSTDSGGSESQQLFFYAEHERDSYWDYQNNEEIFIEYTSGFGVIFSDPLPSFEYYKMGTTTFSGENFYNYYPGYISFRDFTNDENSRLTEILDPLNVEIKTSQGKLNGTIDLPNMLESISLSANTQLALGEPFTISWTGGNADFYSVGCEYEYIDNEGNWEYEDLDDFISANSITYPGSIFSYDGYIGYIRIQPMNGPIPEEGSVGNMSGDGSGYLYYMVDDTQYENEQITVGSGINYGVNNLSKRSIRNFDEKVYKEKIREQIKNAIIGSK